MSGTHEETRPSWRPTESFPLRGFSAGEFEGDKTARNSDYLNTAEFLAQVEISPRTRPSK